MSESTSNGRGRRCPVCGRGILRSRVISEVFEYGEEGDSVLVRTQDVPIEDCDACGESFSGPKAAVIRHEAIGRALALLTPPDIRAMRERLGRSPEDFARLVGVSASRLAKWEDGSVWQDRTADRLIRLLARSRENVEYLESLINGHVAETQKPEPRAQAAVTIATDKMVEHPRKAGGKAETGAVGLFRGARHLRFRGPDADDPVSSPEQPPSSSAAQVPAVGSTEPRKPTDPDPSVSTSQQSPPT